MKEVTTTIIKPKLSWRERKAIMIQRTSHMEEAVRIALTVKGYHAETDRMFCLLSSTPDFYFHKYNLAVYLDGEKVHRKRQEKDRYLRELLVKRYGFRVLSLTYNRYSKAQLNEIVQQIIQSCEVKK